MYTVVAVHYLRETDGSSYRPRSTHKAIGAATHAAAVYAERDANPDNHYIVTDEKGRTVFSTSDKEAF